MLSHHCKRRKKNLYLIFVSRLFNLDIFLSLSLCFSHLALYHINRFVFLLCLLFHFSAMNIRRPHASMYHPCTYCFMFKKKHVAENCRQMTLNEGRPNNFLKSNLNSAFSSVKRCELP